MSNDKTKITIEDILKAKEGLDNQSLSGLFDYNQYPNLTSPSDFIESLLENACKVNNLAFDKNRMTKAVLIGQYTLELPKLVNVYYDGKCILVIQGTLLFSKMKYQIQLI